MSGCGLRVRRIAEEWIRVLDFKWLRRRLRRRPPVIVPESNPALVVLRELVAEIEGAGYRGRDGGRLELKPAFRDARDLVRGYPRSRGRRVRT